MALPAVPGPESSLSGNAAGFAQDVQAVPVRRIQTNERTRTDHVVSCSSSASDRLRRKYTTVVQNPNHAQSDLTRR